MYLLLHPIDDVVHATGSESADGNHDHGEADENLGQGAALGLRLLRRR